MTTSLFGAARRSADATRARCRHLGRQAGAFAVEFGLVAMVFLTIVFTIMEISRAMYMWNALQEVTRRAARDAAMTDFSNPGAMDAVRQNAIFRDTPGVLMLGAPVTNQHIRIDYMALQNAPNNSLNMVQIPTAALPACPTRNKIICTASPGAPNCIRMVRVRICQPGGGDCGTIAYQSMVPFINFPLTVPVSETIIRAETLGYVPGMAACN